MSPQAAIETLEQNQQLLMMETPGRFRDFAGRAGEFLSNATRKATRLAVHGTVAVTGIAVAGGAAIADQMLDDTGPAYADAPPAIPAGSHRCVGTERPYGSLFYYDDNNVSQEIPLCHDGTTGGGTSGGTGSSTGGESGGSGDSGATGGSTGGGGNKPSVPAAKPSYPTFEQVLAFSGCAPGQGDATEAGILYGINGNDGSPRLIDLVANCKITFVSTEVVPLTGRPPTNLDAIAAIPYLDIGPNAAQITEYGRWEKKVWDESQAPESSVPVDSTGTISTDISVDPATTEAVSTDEVTTSVSVDVATAASVDAHAPQTTTNATVNEAPTHPTTTTTVTLAAAGGFDSNGEVPPSAPPDKSGSKTLLLELILAGAVGVTAEETVRRTRGFRRGSLSQKRTPKDGQSGGQAGTGTTPPGAVLTRDKTTLPTHRP